MLDPQLGCEIFYLTLAPNSEHLSTAHSGTVIEHVLVIEGTLDVLVNKRWRAVNSTEGLRFVADQKHGYRNSSNKPVRFYNIIHHLNSF